MASTRYHGTDRRRGFSLSTLRRTLLVTLWLAVVMLLAVSAVSFVLWRRDVGEIRSLVAARIDENGSPDEIIRGALEFLTHDVGYGSEPDYFLLPIFRFMRPTARQIIRGGGACAHRTRLFIVILRQYGIEASKRALYDREGRPVHVVAEVKSERGPLFVDLLFNIAHEREDRTPLTLAALVHEDTLRQSIERWVASGREDVKHYPLDQYQFTDLRTINWNKNTPLRLTYDVLRIVVGESRAKAFPRPYLSEEPALMVIVMCIGASLGLLLLIWMVSRLHKPETAYARQGS